MKGEAVNRFEALNILDLDETATEQDIRLAYYGIEKAVATQNFDQDEKFGPRVNGFLDHAREARDFLLENGATKGSKTQKSFSQAFRDASDPTEKKKTGKLRVSAQDDAWARLSGLQALRVFVLSYRDHETSLRNQSIGVLIACIIVSFIMLRYLRGMPRIAVVSVLVIIAAVGSATLTTSQRQCRTARTYVMDIDSRIHVLKDKLGIEDPDYVQPPTEGASAGSQVNAMKVADSNAFVRCWHRVKDGAAKAIERFKAWRARRKQQKNQ